MSSMEYTVPAGVHQISANLLDLRSDADIDGDLLSPTPISDEKNIWFFWHSGFEHMHPYTKRNVRAWHRRFSKLGWVIRVIDRQPSSPFNVANFLDISDPTIFPQAFIDGTIGGDHAPQHTSDLVRFPLLLKYGGVYADVGLLQIGDLDRLWNQTIGNPQSPYEVLCHDGDSCNSRTLTNYFLASGRDNRFFHKCHTLFLALWAEDGGKTSTEGMHRSLLIKDAPLMGGDIEIDNEKEKIGPEEMSRILTDYIMQGHVMTMVLGTVDDEGGWDGPRYALDHLYAIEFMVGAQLINEMTAWDGQKAFNLMSLHLPGKGGHESTDQQLAREIVEACLSKSFAFKLAHGLIIRVFGHTLGSLWREHEGSDDVPGTYAHWLRYGMIHWTQDEIPSTLDLKQFPPLKRGPLLGEK